MQDRLVSILSKDLRFTWISNTLPSMRPLNEYIGRQPMDFAWPDHRERIEKCYREVSEGVRDSVTLLGWSGDGGKTWLSQVFLVGTHPKSWIAVTLTLYPGEVLQALEDGCDDSYLQEKFGLTNMEAHLIVGGYQELKKE